MHHRRHQSCLGVPISRSCTATYGRARGAPEAAPAHRIKTEPGCDPNMTMSGLRMHASRLPSNLSDDGPDSQRRRYYLYVNVLFTLVASDIEARHATRLCLRASAGAASHTNAAPLPPMLSALPGMGNRIDRRLRCGAEAASLGVSGEVGVGWSSSY